MQIKVEVSDELAMRLNPLQEQLPQIIELGLREWNAEAQSGFSGLAEKVKILQMKRLERIEQRRLLVQAGKLHLPT